MRTLEEIEADIKVAQDRLFALREEKRTMQIAATGLHGHVVSYRRTTWRNRAGTEVRFLVEGTSRWGGGNKLRGRMFRKDGSLGVKEAEAYTTALTDHGVYEASK